MYYIFLLISKFFHSNDLIKFEAEKMQHFVSINNLLEQIGIEKFKIGLHGS